jgi:hypothetical protein
MYFSSYANSSCTVSQYPVWASESKNMDSILYKTINHRANHLWNKLRKILLVLKVISIFSLPKF